MPTVNCVSGCWIGGIFYSPSQTNPANVCQVCTPSSSTGAWSSGPPGIACPDDGNACTSDICNAAGACTHPPKTEGSSCGTGMICCSGACSSIDDPCTCGSCGNCCNPPGWCNTTTHICTTTCFAAGTPVRMADGTDRPIEKIRAGDRVLAYDVAAGRTVASVVTETFHHAAGETRATLLVNGTLRATPEHPFFANGHWVRAAELGVGDVLLEVGEDGRTVNRVPVRSIERLPGEVETFNLEVAGAHDYFADGILVHNKPPTCSTGCF